MAMSNFGELKTSVAAWSRRAGNADYVALVPDYIALAEARLNRELGPVETNATRTGVIGSRNIDISALTIVEPIALWIADPGSEDENEVQQQAPAKMAYAETNGRPEEWTYDSDTDLKLSRPCDQEYAFRFRFRQRFALSADGDTNWLLENHPDIYLAASMMWGAAYREDWPNGASFAAILDTEVPKVAHTLAKQRKGTLRVDPALSRIGSYQPFDYTTGQ